MFYEFVNWVYCFSGVGILACGVAAILVLIVYEEE